MEQNNYNYHTRFVSDIIVYEEFINTEQKYCEHRVTRLMRGGKITLLYSILALILA